MFVDGIVNGGPELPASVFRGESSGALSHN
jgi:hypothetical protein